MRLGCAGSPRDSGDGDLERHGRMRVAVQLRSNTGAVGIARLDHANCPGADSGTAPVRAAAYGWQ